MNSYSTHLFLCILSFKWRKLFDSVMLTIPSLSKGILHFGNFSIQFLSYIVLNLFLLTNSLFLSKHACWGLQNLCCQANITLQPFRSASSQILYMTHSWERLLLYFTQFQRYNEFSILVCVWFLNKGRGILSQQHIKLLVPSFCLFPFSL